jgi:hypothetical protein
MMCVPMKISNEVSNENIRVNIIILFDTCEENNILLIIVILIYY